jgi:hypothetical protein
MGGTENNNGKTYFKRNLFVPNTETVLENKIVKTFFEPFGSEFDGVPPYEPSRYLGSQQPPTSWPRPQCFRLCILQIVAEKRGIGASFLLVLVFPPPILIPLTGPWSLMMLSSDAM